MPHPHEATEKTPEMKFYYHPPPQRLPPPYYHAPTAQLPAYDHYRHPHYPTPPPPITRFTGAPPPPRQSSLPPPVVYVHPSLASKNKTSEVIYDIRDADVLCGRGAPSNYHAGNKYFRKLVNQFQSSYIAARRIDKPEIATHIVDLVRERGGRFLKRTKMQGVGPSGHFAWQDIGEQRSYEKACQALREGAPELRRKLASKEMAAAALCNLDSVGSSGSHHSPSSIYRYHPEERDCASTTRDESFSSHEARDA
jgi:hypothetical protein